jgi:hypothetical protein
LDRCVLPPGCDVCDNRLYCSTGEPTIEFPDELIHHLDEHVMALPGRSSEPNSTGKRRETARTMVCGEGGRSPLRFISVHLTRDRARDNDEDDRDARTEAAPACDAAEVDHLKRFTARATTRIPTTSEIASSAIIMTFAHGLIAETSVGLNAVAVLKDRCK